jgi:hypothetical protein
MHHSAKQYSWPPASCAGLLPRSTTIAAITAIAKTKTPPRSGNRRIDTFATASKPNLPAAPYVRARYRTWRCQTLHHYRRPVTDSKHTAVVFAPGSFVGGVAAAKRSFAALTATGPVGRSASGSTRDLGADQCAMNVEYAYWSRLNYRAEACRERKAPVGLRSAPFRLASGPAPCRFCTGRGGTHTTAAVRPMTASSTRSPSVLSTLRQ